MKAKVINFNDVKAVKEEIQEMDYSLTYKRLINMKIEETISIVVSGDYLRGQYKVNTYQKISQNEVKFIKSETLG